MKVKGLYSDINIEFCKTIFEEIANGARPTDDYEKFKVWVSSGNLSYKESLEFVDSIIDKMYKGSKKDIYKMLVFYRDKLSDFMDMDSKIVINKLIGDRKLLSKIKVINDGSYTCERICGFSFTADYKITVSPSLSYTFQRNHPQEYKQTKTMTDKSKIDFMYNHFRYIYFQPFCIEVNMENFFTQLSIKQIDDELVESGYYDYDPYDE